MDISSGMGAWEEFPDWQEVGPPDNDN